MQDEGFNSYLCTMKILAIDYGAKRCGIAETDELQMIASPLTTVSTERLTEFLEDYLKENSVEMVVIGQPFREDGGLNPLEKSIRRFIKTLNERFPGLKIEREDERYTSKLAFDAMLSGGVKRKRRRDKALVDKISATIILQSYLENRKS